MWVHVHFGQKMEQQYGSFSHWSWNPNLFHVCMILLREFEHMLCCREIKALVENFRTTPTHEIQNNLFKKAGLHLFTPPWMDGVHHQC